MKHNQNIRRIADSDREWVHKVLNDTWGSCRVVTRGVLHQADELPGFIAEINEENVGVVTWNKIEQDLEIITLNVLEQRQGIGKALVKTVVSEAEFLECSRVWVITTNDNKPALKFYKAVGFQTAAVHKDAVTESRKLKPEIPLVGFEGIPIRDEIELEMILRR